MSGTLDPFEVYKNVTGFTDTNHMIVPYIFPVENRKIVYDGSITTKYDEFDDQEAARMHDMIEKLITTAGRNTIVFFPSYSTMDKVSMQGFSFRYFSERRNIDQGSLMEMVRKFRKGKSAIFAVSGGRISEGMNFPGVELEMVIIAGIPYPRPDAKQKAIMEYYERKYGNGWLYSVIFPTAIRMKQAIGRLIRNEKDRGMAKRHRATARGAWVRATSPGNTDQSLRGAGQCGAPCHRPAKRWRPTSSSTAVASLRC